MNLQEEMKQFEDWWYEHNEPNENPYKSKSTLTFWAWEAWKAGRATLAQPEPTYKPIHSEIKKMYEDYFDAAFEKLVPPQREWQGLTDKEIKKARQEGFYLGYMCKYDMFTFAHAIEAKLKEKNGF